jgi:DNA-binding GntR family transcriptional regulator
MTQAEIIQALTKAIDQGEFNYGDKLPSTRDLAKKYNSTQQTVAAALTVMASLGMVQVLRGWGSKVISGKAQTIKLGTFLSANQEVPTGKTAWTRDNGEGAKEGPTQVSQTVLTEDDADTGIPVGAEIVERTRTRFGADGAPCQHKRTLVTVEAATLKPEGWAGLPPMMSPGDVPPPAGMSVAKWLGMGVERVVYDICTAPAAGPAATALMLPEGTPCLRIVSQGIKGDGQVAYSTVTTAPLRSSISLEIKDGDAG